MGVFAYMRPNITHIFLNFGMVGSCMALIDPILLEIVSKPFRVSHWEKGRARDKFLVSGNPPKESRRGNVSAVRVRL